MLADLCYAVLSEETSLVVWLEAIAYAKTHQKGLFAVIAPKGATNFSSAACNSSGLQDFSCITQAGEHCMEFCFYFRSHTGVPMCGHPVQVACRIILANSLDLMPVLFEASADGRLYGLILRSSPKHQHSKLVLLVEGIPSEEAFMRYYVELLSGKTASLEGSTMYITDMDTDVLTSFLGADLGSSCRQCGFSFGSSTPCQLLLVPCWLLAARAP